MLRASEHGHVHYTGVEAEWPQVEMRTCCGFTVSASSRQPQERTGVHAPLRTSAAVHGELEMEHYNFVFFVLRERDPVTIVCLFFFLFLCSERVSGAVEPRDSGKSSNLCNA